MMTDKKYFVNKAVSYFQSLFGSMGYDSYHNGRDLIFGVGLSKLKESEIEKMISEDKRKENLRRRLEERGILQPRDRLGRFMKMAKRRNRIPLP